MNPRVAVVGAGPAGLMAAETLGAAGVAVTVYDRMPSPARKFLLAGRGGLNLTHAEPAPAFLARYGDAAPRLAPALGALGPGALRAWCEDLGQPTFAGSSGRVFPRSLKSSPLLRAWLARLAALGVTLRPRHLWRGWDGAGALRFDTPEGEVVDAPDATVLALGGASWPRLGSDGAWAGVLEGEGAAVAPFAPANCGFEVPWSGPFRARFEGEPLKRVALTLDGETVRGELVVTRAGLEGGPLYALGPRLRAALARDGEARPALDLRPDLTLEALAARLARPRGGASASTFLRKAAALPPVAVALLREGGEALPADPAALAARIKAVPLRLTATAPMARAISTAGGLRFDALDGSLMVRARPGVFAAGEMLDWEAPTGGYLMQGAFSTGVLAARGALAWVGR